MLWIIYFIHMSVSLKKKFCSQLRSHSDPLRVCTGLDFNPASSLTLQSYEGARMQIVQLGSLQSCKC